MNKIYTYRKGQYVMARYDGKNNGDLIVGRVVSVRTSGHVVLRNLITEKDSTKLARVLAVRNIVVPAKVAMRVLQVWGDLHNKSATRREAVKVYKEMFLDTRPSKPREVSEKKQVDLVRKSIDALSEKGRMMLFKGLLQEVSKELGVLK